MLFDDLVSKKAKLAVVGLGYVGMPLAINFAYQLNVIGFDIDKRKIALYKSGKDVTNEVGDDAVKNTSIQFSCDEKDLRDARFIIVAVPTPVNEDKTPDLSPVVGASEVIGRNLQKGSIVVYESTVYPGVTEDVCVPIIERLSGLKCGSDWSIGYSPERINPGDPVHRVFNIKKIVSGMDASTLDQVAKTYELIVKTGVHRASSIKVAEAAKVIENSQRDINIAFMNEVAMVFHRMGIDTQEVIDAMNTKWNALGFMPGLVGGHCIGVDPYYFTYESEKLGYHSRIILSGREVNDDMGGYIGEEVVKQMVLAKQTVSKSIVTVLGVTFKENCQDTRNSKVLDIIKKLNEYGIVPNVYDPYVSSEKDIHNDVHAKFTVYASIDSLPKADCAIVAVAHSQFKQMDVAPLFAKNVSKSQLVVIDVKSILGKDSLVKDGYQFWRL
jgi:UDP-N-acetyl-D-glucosamine/UDP-N-acetyl-D-galactosamine dehydrogenase